MLGSISATTNRGSLGYTLSAQSNAGALLLSSSGEISVGDPEVFDFESTQVVTANVTISNEDVSEEVMVTVNITDEAEEVITFATGQTFQVAENQVAPGVPIGTVMASSSINSAITYSITSIDPTLANDAIVIDANSGVISTGAGVEGQIDFEQFETIDVTVVATSSTGLTAETEIAITVLNLPEIRFDAARFNTSIQENVLSVGDQVISWTITSDRDIESYELTDLASGQPVEGFTIDAANNRLLLADEAALDFELVQEYELRILANGVGGGVATATLGITIGDDPSDNSVLETADIYYNLDTDLNNSNGSNFNAAYIGQVGVTQGVFGEEDRNGEMKAMGFGTTRVGIETRGWNSDVHNGVFTIAMWVKLRKAGTGNRMVYEFNCGVDEALGVFFETATGRLFLRQQNGQGQINGTDLISTLYTSVNDTESDWVFLSVSVSNDQIVSFMRAPNTTRFNSDVTISSGDKLYSGHTSTSTPLNISGQRCNNAAAAAMTLDDVAIFNRALTATEMANLYIEFTEQ